VHCFETSDEAKEKIDAWRLDYNESRPHQALNELTPAEYAGRMRLLGSSKDLKQAED
jgi:putative transposase